MNLQKLTLRHFRGQTNFELDAQGKNVTIYADNGIGKTTIADAFFWLLFGKDSRNRAKFDIKFAPNGTVLSGLNAVVEGAFEVGGKTLTLSRDYHEVASTKRGSLEAQVTGNTTDFRVNEVPVSESIYLGKIKEFCDENLFRMLTDPEHFASSMKWQDRRVMLLEICGDVTTEDVIASDKSLAPLAEALGGRSIEDFRTITTSLKTKTAEAKKSIPTRLDEARRSMPTIEDSEEGGDLALLQKDLADLQKKQLGLAEGGAVRDKKSRQAEIKVELSKIELQMQREARGDLDEVEKQLRVKKSALGEVEDKIRRKESQISEAQRIIGECETDRAALRQDYTDLSALTFEFKGDTSCVTCGQDLPVGKLAEIKERAEARFNDEKATGLSGIMAKGLAKKSRQEELEAGVQEKQKEIETLRDQVATIQTEIDELDEKLRGTEAPVVDLSANLEAKTLMDESDRLAGEIVQLQEGNDTELREVASQISRVQTRIGFAQKRKAAESQKEQITNRIAELEEEQKTLAKEFEKLEKHLFLVESFIRAKVKLLTDKINSKFDLVAFKLFDEQINGGLTECCEATFEGRPYATALSTSERINAGLDIINTLSRHYGFAPPIFIDNAEAANHIIATEGQQIRLRVSTDKSLRVEVAEEAKELAGAF
jgi:DNA repair exonuclease SbcCD ATPase subunit